MSIPMLVLFAIVAVAPSPKPAPTQAEGPCGEGALSSISDRPGLGRSPATNGAACVAHPGTVIVEAGYRNQVTVGPGTQTLSAYPDPIVRIGLQGQNEIVVSPYTYTQRTGYDKSSGFLPAAGSQDVGLGFKHLLNDNAWRQDAINLFVTFPNGHPNGASGFTAGLPTYTVGYSDVFAMSGAIGLSTTQNLILNAAPNSNGTPQRFFTYQPAVSVSYSLSPNFTYMIQDQLTMPPSPGAGTGNRALSGIQCTLSPNLVLDAEFEVNLLPQPGLSQHAIDAGLTVRP
jgi:hypothetical protein